MLCAVASLRLGVKPLSADFADYADFIFLKPEAQSLFFPFASLRLGVKPLPPPCLPTTAYCILLLILSQISLNQQA